MVMTVRTTDTDFPLRVKIKIIWPFFVHLPDRFKKEIKKHLTNKKISIDHSTKYDFA